MLLADPPIPSPKVLRRQHATCAVASIMARDSILKGEGRRAGEAPIRTNRHLRFGLRIGSDRDGNAPRMGCGDSGGIGGRLGVFGSAPKDRRFNPLEQHPTKDV